MKTERKEKAVIGITGGVGCGKSTVLAWLRRLCQAEIIKADMVARRLMEPGGASYQAVVSAFGEGILLPEGEIDRTALAAAVFGDEKKRQVLNALTHPLVAETVREQIASSTARLIVYEAALPEEAGFSSLCDEIWYVHAPEEERIRRLMASRGYSREKCLAVMASQKSEEGYLRLADRVIENGSSFAETEEQLQIAVQSVMVEQASQDA